MPLQETAAWHVIVKIGAPVVAAIGTAFWWLVRKWVNARFESVEGRMDQVENDVGDLMEDSVEHSTRLESIDTHIEYIRENGDKTHSSIRRLHDKIDNLIASNGRD